MWKSWNWLHRSLFISCVFSLIVDKLLQPSFSSAVPWFLNAQAVQWTLPPQGPENIHLDSANIQSSNTFLLDISLRKKRWREMYQCWYPLVSDITFIKDVRVCVRGLWRMLLCLRLFTEAIPVKHLAQGQRRAAPHSNWTTDPAGLLVTSLGLSRAFNRCRINTSSVNESRSSTQM